MFESDVQQVLDEYVLHRAVREEDLLQDARPWANYARDYRPLLEFCREHGVRVIAANAPRRYVSLVARNGTGALQALLRSGETKQTSPDLPPLPLPPASAAYHHKFVETIASRMAPAEGSACPFIGFRAQDVREVSPGMMDAQLLWDHAMARSIARALQSSGGGSPGPLVLHVCGAFHCAHGLGIPEALPRYRPQLAREVPPRPWLPMDDSLAGIQLHNGLGAAEPIGPKKSPPGVISVVCWPASVTAALEVVHNGHVPRSLGTMGDWVILTEETFGRGVGAAEGAAEPSDHP